MCNLSFVRRAKLPPPKGHGQGEEEDSEEELIRREKEELEDGWVGVGVEDLPESTTIDQLPGNSGKQE